MKQLKNFKLFESDKPEYLTNDDVKDYFIELIDSGHEIKFYGGVSHYNGKYFFELKKSLTEDLSLGFINKGDAYGYTNLKRIEEELDIFKILEESKNRLEALGYIIGFEFELNFSTTAYVNVVCHMKHSGIKSEEGESDDWAPYDV